MILTKLIVENFGPFYGIHEFDLNPLDRSRPIILFGGKNGCGKTSLFEAIKLCLYGNTFRGYPLSSNVYGNYLKGKIHRNAGLIVQPDYASITLEFKYASLGEVDTYRIRRSWHVGGKEDTTKVTDYIEIYKNGKLLDDVEGYQWNNFIRSLIPQGLTNLYFFDGEQIQKLVIDIDSSNNNYDITMNNIRSRSQTLKESFYALFGLDIVERTIIDLNIIKERSVKKRSSNPNKLLEELKQLNIKKEEIVRRLDLLHDEHAQIQNSINYLLGQIEKQERLIAAEGGEYAIKRDEYKRKKEMLDKRIDEIEMEIRRMAEGLLPFALIPEYCTTIRDRIIYEDKYKENVAILRFLHKRLEQLQQLQQEELPMDTLIRELDLDLDNNTIINYNKQEIGKKILLIAMKFLEKIILNDIKEPTIDSRLLYSNYFPTYDMQRLLEWIEKINNDLPTKLYSFTRELDRAIYERGEVEKALLRCPPEESITTLLQQLNKLHTELGEEKVRLAKVDDEMVRLEHEYKEIEKAISKVTEQINAMKHSATRELLIDKLVHVFGEFIERIKEDKSRLLEENLLFCLNKLLHKVNMIDKINVNPKTFSIEIYKDNKIISTESLSAGEKQIYAIALLWALTRCSNKSMPFIIDTPLARLDTSHRANLIMNFFPKASYQVIILSTDTEIDRIYFNELKPYISHAYHLVYNNGMVNVQNGYFWEETMDKEEEKEKVRV